MSALDNQELQLSQRDHETHMMARVRRQTFFRHIFKCPLRTLRMRLLTSFAIGYVSAGFVQAMIFSKAYPTLHDRITEGIAASFLGTILFGFPCCEFGNTVNLWPYIALNTTVVFLLLMVVGYFREPSPGGIS
jgi:hypothetical protein